MQCWAGVTSKSLVQVKDALTQVMNENREADPYGRGQEVSVSSDPCATAPTSTHVTALKGNCDPYKSRESIV